MPTLVMLHGMTGTASMMQPFAESIAPNDWKVNCPEAIFPHPKRGKSWWRYEDFSDDSPRKNRLSGKELSDVDKSLADLSSVLGTECIVGGFSQGGAMAQELLQLDAESNIKGLICIATRVIRPMELRVRLAEIEPRPVLWMHGLNDHRVPFENGIEVAEIFSQAGWPVTRIEHGKGHMIPTEYHQEISAWLDSISL